MHTAQDWQLIRRYRCPNCHKRYGVVQWRQDAKCRQCGAELRPDELSDKRVSKPQTKANSLPSDRTE